MCFGLGGGHPVHMARGERHIVEHAEMRKQVEALEDGTDSGAHGIRLDGRVADVDAPQPDLAVVDLFEQVDRAKQGGFARPTGADERKYLVRVDREVDSAQHLGVAEGLVDVLEPQHGVAHTTPPICSRLRSRAETQSVRRMSGSASSTKSRPATT